MGLGWGWGWAQRGPGSTRGHEEWGEEGVGGLDESSGALGLPDRSAAFPGLPGLRAPAAGQCAARARPTPHLLAPELLRCEERQKSVLVPQLLASALLTPQLLTPGLPTPELLAPELLRSEERSRTAHPTPAGPRAAYPTAAGPRAAHPRAPDPNSGATQCIAALTVIRRPLLTPGPADSHSSLRARVCR